MSRPARVAAGIALLGISAVLVLYGLFAITYEGDRESGATYVPIEGHDVDADYVGAVALLLALVALGAAVAPMRRR